MPKTQVLRLQKVTLVYLFFLVVSSSTVEAVENCPDGWAEVGHVETARCSNADGVEHTASTQCVQVSGKGGCCNKQEMRDLAIDACWKKHGAIADPIVDPAPTGRFGLDLTVGTGGLSGFDDQRFFAVVSPRLLLHRGRDSIVSITVPLLVFGGTCTADSLGTVRALPGGGLEDQDLVAAKEVRLGPAWGVVPGVEYTFRANSKLQPAVFLGVGIRYEPGGEGSSRERSVRIPAKTEGLLSYGVSLSYSFSQRTLLRLEWRGMTVLGANRIGQVADGGAFVIEEDATTGLSLSAGVSFAF